MASGTLRKPTRYSEDLMKLISALALAVLGQLVSLCRCCSLGADCVGDDGRVGQHPCCGGCSHCAGSATLFTAVLAG